MQAIKLSKKYPEFKQDEIFDLINKFKWVCCGCASARGVADADSRSIDVDDKGSLDKAEVITALQNSGDADYDSVRAACCTRGWRR